MANEAHVVVQVYVTRVDADNWWVTAGGIGVPVNLPRSQVTMPDGIVPGPLAPPVEAVLPRWLAEDRGLLARRDERQGELL